MDDTYIAGPDDARGYYGEVYGAEATNCPFSLGNTPIDGRIGIDAVVKGRDDLPNNSKVVTQSVVLPKNPYERMARRVRRTVPQKFEVYEPLSLKREHKVVLAIGGGMLLLALLGGMGRK